MTTRLGVSLNGKTVRAVAVHDGNVVWTAERRLPDAAELAVALQTMLQSLPKSRRLRPRVIFAIGPANVQVKTVAGLPPLNSCRDVSRVIGESARRFFLTNGEPVLTSAYQDASSATVWAAAFDKRVVDALTAACAAARFRLVAVVPSVVVLGVGVEDQEIAWRDGDTVLRLDYSGGRLAGVARQNGPQTNAVTPTPVAALERLGPDAWRFADAFGAGLNGNGGRLALRPGSKSSKTVPKWRVAVALAALLAAGVFAFLAPGVTALRTAREAEVALLDNIEVRSEALRAEAELRTVSEALAQYTMFSRMRRSRLLLLESLSAALPSPGAIVALSLVRADGDMVFLVPDGSGPLEWLERLPGILSPQIVGPITREAAAGETSLARVTVRFTLAANQQSPSAPGENQ